MVVAELFTFPSSNKKSSTENLRRALFGQQQQLLLLLLSLPSQSSQITTIIAIIIQKLFPPNQPLFELQGLQGLQQSPITDYHLSFQQPQLSPQPPLFKKSKRNKIMNHKIVLELPLLPQPQPFPNKLNITVTSD